MSLRLFLISVITVFFISVLKAEIAADSLLIELKNTKQNKEKTLLLNELSTTISETNLDSSIYYAKQGLALASEINYSLGIAENAASIADYYIIYDSVDRAKEYYLLAVKQFDILEMPQQVAGIYMVLGNIYLIQNKYSDALIYYQKCQRIGEEGNFKIILTRVFNNTGLIYSNLGETDKALEYFLKAYTGFKSLDFKEDLARSVSNIADIYLAKGQDSLALQYYSEGLKLHKEMGNLIDASFIYIEIGNFQFSKGNLQQALDNYEEAFRLIDNPNVDYLGPKSMAVVSVLGNLGRVQNRMGNKKKAIDYLKQALILAKQNHYLNWIEFCTQELSQVYESKSEYKKSLDYYKIYKQYADSILNEGNIKKITQMEMQFDFDKKTKERELEDARKETVQQRKEFIYIIFISLGVLIAIIILLMYIGQRRKTARIELLRQNLKLKHEKLELELEHRNKELATNVMYLLQKNEFITSTAETLAKAQLSFKKENQKLIQNIIRGLLLNSSKDVWKEFEIRFQEVHSDFYENLNKRFPDLTPNERKICAFLRLNMSTKDISAITYQSLRSINMARFRLRKKMELDTDENLVVYLSQI